MCFLCSSFGPLRPDAHALGYEFDPLGPANFLDHVWRDNVSSVCYFRHVLLLIFFSFCSDGGCLLFFISGGILYDCFDLRCMCVLCWALISRSCVPPYEYENTPDEDEFCIYLFVIWFLLYLLLECLIWYLWIGLLDYLCLALDSICQDALLFFHHHHYYYYEKYTSWTRTVV